MSASIAIDDPACVVLVETPFHDAAIERLYDRAFGPGRFAKTAERLREGNHRLMECGRVAMRDDEVIAAVRLWPLQIGERVMAVFVGPVAVDPDYRGGSLGLKLTGMCMDAAAAAGWDAAILVGDADYFGHIGFEQISTRDFSAPGYVPANRLLARALKPGALDGVSGALSVPPVATPEA